MPRPYDGPFFTTFGCFAYAAWLSLCVALHLLLPGARVEGTRLVDGTCLVYKMNGLLVRAWPGNMPNSSSGQAVPLYSLAVSAARLQRVPERALRRQVVACALVICVGAMASGVLPPAVVHAEFVPIMSAALVFSAAMSVWLYVRSFRQPAPLLAAGGDTGSVVYDLYIGRELNPRLGSFDLKQWCELVPGLALWLLLDVAFALAQRNRDGALQPAMALVLQFHALYVVDAVANER